MRVTIKKVNEKNWSDWLKLRQFFSNNQKKIDNIHTYFDENSPFNYVNDPVWVAYVGKKPVGFIEMGISSGEVWYKSKMSYLKTVYVIPELHKKGIASRLVYIASRWTKKRKLAFMGSHSKVDNEVSIKMHLALGFQFIVNINGEAKFLKGIE
jgi:GNAT superfamily N-acetyltransferase